MEPLIVYEGIYSPQPIVGITGAISISKDAADKLYKAWLFATMGKCLVSELEVEDLLEHLQQE